MEAIENSLQRLWPTNEVQCKMDYLFENFSLLPFKAHREVVENSFLFDPLIRSNAKWTLSLRGFITIAFWRSQGGLWRFYEDINSQMRFNAKWTLFVGASHSCLLSFTVGSLKALLWRLWSLSSSVIKKMMVYVIRENHYLNKDEKKEFSSIKNASLCVSL